MRRRMLDDRIGWYDNRDQAGRWRDTGWEHLAKREEPRRPWWLPAGTHLTKRGEQVAFMVQVFLIMLVLLFGLAFVGGIEQGTL